MSIACPWARHLGRTIAGHGTPAEHVLSLRDTDGHPRSLSNVLTQILGADDARTIAVCARPELIQSLVASLTGLPPPTTDREAIVLVEAKDGQALRRVEGTLRAVLPASLGASFRPPHSPAREISSTPSLAITIAAGVATCYFAQVGLHDGSGAARWSAPEFALQRLGSTGALSIVFSTLAIALGVASLISERTHGVASDAAPPHRHTPGIALALLAVAVAFHLARAGMGWLVVPALVVLAGIELQRWGRSTG